MLEAQGDGLAETLAPALSARLDLVRTCGYEDMQSLQTRGVLNLSAPVWGPAGTVLAVLTCPYTEPVERADAPPHAAVVKLLLATADEISRRDTMSENGRTA